MPRIQGGKPSTSPQTFMMIRGADESGVSGTGKVLEGVQFSDGTVVVRWLTPNQASSTAVYESFDSFESIHIKSHPTNRTRIIWHEKSKGTVDPDGVDAGDCGPSY